MAKQRFHTAAIRLRGAVGHPTTLLCVAGLVLPNLLAFAAILTGLDVPLRPFPIIAYAVIAIIARSLAFPIVAALFLLVFIADVSMAVSLLFNLTPDEFFGALGAFDAVNVLKSPLYVALIGISAAVLVLNIGFLAINRSRLRQGSLLVLVALLFSAVAADFGHGDSPHYHLGSLYAAGRPMESAAVSSGFRPAVLAGKKQPVLLVVVEAMGQFVDPDRRSDLTAALSSTAVLDRYTLTQGSTPSYGATTAAEMRELCFTRESYTVFLHGSDIRCLPRELAKAGYQTISLHNFVGGFFDRSRWYPNAGFDRSLFRESLTASRLRECGGVFRGPCDVELIPMIEQQFSNAKKPTFLYWLTLSTHVPILSGEGSGRLGCNKDGGKIGHREVCEMTEMWVDLLEGIGRMVANLPPMEVLIVGDHAPPLWSTAGRKLFVPGQVPWFRLTPRPEQQISTR